MMSAAPASFRAFSLHTSATSRAHIHSKSASASTHPSSSTASYAPSCPGRLPASSCASSSPSEVGRQPPTRCRDRCREKLAAASPAPPPLATDCSRRRAACAAANGLLHARAPRVRAARQVRRAGAGKGRMCVCRTDNALRSPPPPLTAHCLAAPCNRRRRWSATGARAATRATSSWTRRVRAALEERSLLPTWRPHLALVPQTRSRRQGVARLYS